jgi:branched-chain amino acid transport system substrate-binding protein
VFYKGGGSPQYIIATDLPLTSPQRPQTTAMQQAVQYVLEKQFKFKAGVFRIGYQPCDDATPQANKWDPAKCSSNARAYAADKSVIGVMGTFNSGCAKLVIPILNRAPNGPLAMISSANTAVELTHTAPWTAPGEPGVYYPTGKRNYVRVSATDDYQGPAGADLLKSKKIKTVYVIHDNEVFGKGVANGFQSRATALGIKVVAFEPWDAKQTSYEALAEKIKSSGAQAVYMGGIVCNNGVKLLQDLRAGVGPNVLFAGPDGWTPYDTTLKAGSAAQGMYISYAGQPLQKLGPAGKKFIADLKAYAKIKGQLPPYAVYQGQSAQILLNAIAKSNGTRASVTTQLFKQRVVNGIMGTFNFDKNGDTVPTKWISFDQLKGNVGVYAFAVATKVKA